MNVIKRAQAPTPKFFKVLRGIGISLATVGGTIITTSNNFPPGLLTIGGYLAVAGTVLSAVSQITTLNDSPNDKQ